MKIIITGGAGFIGGNFIHIMLKKYPEDEIICLDALTYAGNLDTLEPVCQAKNLKFVQADIANRIKVYDLFAKEKPDVVINFAVENFVDRSLANSELFLQTNLIGTSVLLDACLKYGIKHLHHVSTAEVYGEVAGSKPLLFTEEQALHPLNPYAAAKAAADLLVLSYYQNFGMPVTISRCSNNYGPYEFPQKFIPCMIVKALNNQELPICGKGENLHDWLYVADHCQAIDLIIRQGKAGEVYNIGGNSEKTNLEVVKAILKELGKGEEDLKFLAEQTDPGKHFALDITKIQKELGWKPETSFEAGIKKTIIWYLSHKPWWQRIISGEYQTYYKKTHNR